MSANINKNGIIECSPMENYDVASIIQDDIEVGENLLKYGKIDKGSYANSLTFDAATNTYTCIAKASTSMYDATIGGSPQVIIPWGYPFRVSVEVYVPKSVTFSIDQNDYATDGSTSGNDNTAKRTLTYFNIPEKVWTKVFWGAENSYESKNPNHSNLYIRDSFGITTDDSEDVTWYFRNPKVELGEKATPWCPAPSDNMGPTLQTITNPIELNTFYEI